MRSLKNKERIYLFSTAVITVVLSLFVSCSNEQFADEVLESVKGDSDVKLSINIENPGFESGKVSWGDEDDYAISSDENSGSRAGKVSGSGKIEQTVSVSQNTEFILKAWVQGEGRLSIGGESINFDADDYEQISISFNSGNSSSVTILGISNDDDVRFDDFTLESIDGNTNSGDNLALGKVAEQSSTSFGGSPERAVDGNTSGIWNQRSVTHTSNTDQPWWQVRLGDEYAINEIVIWNRTNCCINRLSNFDVFIYNDAGEQVFKTTIEDTPSPSVAINAGGATGSRVRVKLKGTNYLSLAEVQVFGSEDGGNGDDDDGDNDDGDNDDGDNGGGNGNGDTADEIIGNGWKLNGFSGSLSVGNNDNGLDYEDDASTSESHFFFENNGYATFRSYPGNPTSGGSSNSRSELREEIDGGDGFWDGTTNTERSMKWRFKVEDLPPSGKLCFGQIHERDDDFDDIIRVQVEGDEGQNSGGVTLRILGYVTEELEGSGRSIDFDMSMDTEYYFELTMRNSVVRLYELNNNGSRVRTLYTSPNVGDADENYFKAGCYLQSTRSSHEDSDIYGQVAIKDLTVSPND